MLMRKSWQSTYLIRTIHTPINTSISVHQEKEVNVTFMNQFKWSKKRICVCSNAYASISIELRFIRTLRSSSDLFYFGIYNNSAWYAWIPFLKLRSLLNKKKYLRRVNIWTYACEIRLSRWIGNTIMHD